jgi:hypothetical protein
MPNKLPIATGVLLLFTWWVAAQTTWVENSFEDFRDGTFTDAGSNLYVSAKGRIQMITRWDFNNDGNLDILLAAGQGQTEKENTFIYLNNGQDIDGRSRIELPGGGSRAGLVCDFNKDGYNDIAIVNASDSHFSRVNAWIYFGSEDGFRVENRIELPAYHGRAIAVGDFNNDSWMDLAIACQWQDGTVTDPKGSKMSFIYWNSPQGFNSENRLPLLLEGNIALDMATDDLDQDNKDDLIIVTRDKTYFYYSSDNAFSAEGKFRVVDQGGSAIASGKVNDDPYKEIAICEGDKVHLFYGSETGYSMDKRISFDVSKPTDVVFADIDKNGSDELIVSSFATPGGATWTNSYIFSQKKDDSTNYTIQKLPTIGAAAVAAGDLNGDGYPEIIFSNQRITNQLNINSYIYWNDSGKFYFGNHTQLPTLGVMSATIGDVNNDQKPDVIFFNEEGYFRDGPTISKIYWGDNTRNFSESRTTEFHTHHIFGYGHADLDDDGHVDIILSQERFVSRVDHEQNGVIIYWGKGDEQFSAPTFLTMNTAYGGVRIADINKDGYLDLLAGGNCIDLSTPEKHGIVIFWGSASGFSHRNRQIIHHNIEKMRAPLLMDLNKDGWLDITGQEDDGKIKIWWGSKYGFDTDNFQEIDLGRPDHLMYIKGADFNKDGWLDLLLPKRRPHEENTSLIYYGSETGFSNSNRVEIVSNIPYENTICDFDKDGWLDIFLTSYGTDLQGNRPSIIHWGSPDGFNSKPYQEFITHGSSSSEALDYDGDGWIDILVANHRKAGSIDEPVPHKHITPAQLFWGSPDGFSDDQQLYIPAVGPSGMNVRDLGNSYDRGLYEDYVSSEFEIKDGMIPYKINWIAETPFDTSVKFQVRIADTKEELENTEWYGPRGIDSWFSKSGADLNMNEGNWIQYRARLITPNGAATPYLTEVSISFK